MKNKENDDNNKEYKVSPITSEKRGISPIIDRKPGIAAAFAGRKRNPKPIETEADSFIADEKLSVGLKDLGIGNLIGAVDPIIEPEQVPGSTGGNSAGNNIQTHKK